MPSLPARRCAILLASFAEHDATSNDATAMAALLRRWGWKARIFAGGVPEHPEIGTCPDARAFLARKDTVALYHSGGRWDDGMALLASARGPIVVRDHNVTPPGFFAGVNEEFADASIRGLAQRQQLACDPRVVRHLAASTRNADDLREAGAAPDRIRVVPPLRPAGGLDDVAPDLEALRGWQNRPAALFVGRISPNKGHRHLLRVAAAHRELFGEAMPLRLVGATDPRLHSWTAQLDHDIDRLGLRSSLEFCGTLSNAALKAAYLTATAFVCCSEHEGFCVPLVEAAECAVPILAVEEPGVRSTLGDRTLVLPPETDVVATAYHRVTHDPMLRQKLVEQQSATIRDRFSPAVLERALRDALTGI